MLVTPGTYLAMAIVLLILTITIVKSLIFQLIIGTIKQRLWLGLTLWCLGIIMYLTIEVFKVSQYL